MESCGRKSQASESFLKHNNNSSISLHHIISGENHPPPPHPTHLKRSFFPQFCQSLGARKCSRRTTTSYPCHPQCFVEFDGFLQAEKKAKATLQTEVSAVTTSWNNSSWHSIHFRHHLQIRSEQIWSWSLPTILEIFPQFHTCILSPLKQGHTRTRF